MVLSEQRLFRYFDWLLFAMMLLLVALGVVMVYSATASTTGIDWSDLINDLTFRQLLFGGLGLVAFFALTFSDYHGFAALRWLIYGVLMVLLGIVFFIGQSTHGAVRWIDLGVTQFQPSEISKLLIVLVLARYVAEHEHEMFKWRYLLGSLLIVGPPLVLVYLEPDLGTALVLGFAWFTMVAAAGLSWKQWLGMAVVALVLLPLLYLTLQPYQKQRVLTFLDPESDPLGAGYNVRQAEIAIGSGGLLGRGLGYGTQSQLRFLRIRHADFIFSVIGEELGYWGGVFFFLLYVLVLWRMLRAADLARTGYGRMIAIGFAAALFFQTFVNLGMNLGLMPVTGIPLPFVSAGGTSLVTFLMMQGIIQSILLRQKGLSLSAAR